MEQEKFESGLGDVVLTKSHFERDHRVGEGWKEVKEAFKEKEVVDNVHYSNIDKMEYQPEAFFPYINVKLGEKWKKIVMAPEDEHEGFYRRLRYRWNSYKQIYD